MKLQYLALLGAAVFGMAGTAAFAESFNVPGGDLKSALKVYTAQSGVLLLVPADAVRGVQTGGVKGDLSANDALSLILSGTGFVASRGTSGQIEIIRDGRMPTGDLSPLRAIAATPAPSVSGAALETVTVTSSKIGGDVQNIPISITALSQEQLTTRQIAGGPDLVKEVPNLTFSKTNFTGYNIQIRGIGTQAISVTTDPAVAVALNDIPFIRNHFFEQEFYDLSQAEVLRGPQGTLYGRNATAGVVNIVSAKPTDQFEAMISADFGNYHNRRLEGMINLPIVDDRLDIRVAGEWTKRDGYSFNEITNAPIDGRDLWSGRVSIGWKPFENVQTNLVWEYFSEDDDRLRSGKQLCKTAPIPATVGGVTVPLTSFSTLFSYSPGYLSQGCLPVSLYSPDAFQVPESQALPYVILLDLGGTGNTNAYASATQSTNLRHIESTLTPAYKAKNDLIELNTDYKVSPTLTFTSQTGFNHDILYSAEDYNRFNTAPGVFSPGLEDNGFQLVSSDGFYCDPQLGCANRLVAEDLSDERAWQLSQEFRLTSNFSGPLNFSFGGNYLHYETEENYYVFINSVTLQLLRPIAPYAPGVTDNSWCLRSGSGGGNKGSGGYENPYVGISNGLTGCSYVDPNPISNLNNKGHNYFLSQNPYTLNSYAGFGEAYYNVASDLKLTGGLRWTNDRKHFLLIPSWFVASGYGYPVMGTVDQQWSELTGRAAVNWTPKLDFTDQTLVYGSYAHGYKAGGANPPGAVLAGDTQPTHPLTFKPEFIDAFELGSKNTLLDGAITLNGDAFYYIYKGYQISQIVDRTSVNLNFNAKVSGAELEASWEPVPGLKFGFAGGYEASRLDNGQSAIDLMDRAAGNPNWFVMRPYVTLSSNCIFPVYVVAAMLQSPGNTIENACNDAYNLHEDPATCSAYVAMQNPLIMCDGQPGFNIPGLNYPGYDPVSPNATNNGAGPAPNGGAGFSKNVGGNELPGAPHFTTSVTAEYTLPISDAWVATAHTDFYYQADSWARVWNDNPYDRIRGYTNLNLAVIFTNQNGWQVLGYLKNVFNTTAITGDFLNSDDSGLTTNVFLTDPRLFGVRLTKNF